MSDRLREARKYIKNKSRVCDFPISVRLLLDELMYLRRRIVKLEKRK